MPFDPVFGAQLVVGKKPSFQIRAVSYLKLIGGWAVQHVDKIHVEKI
jgi:hypothetical protein